MVLQGLQGFTIYLAWLSGISTLCHWVIFQTHWSVFSCQWGLFFAPHAAPLTFWKLLSLTWGVLSPSSAQVSPVHPAGCSICALEHSWGDSLIFALLCNIFHPQTDWRSWNVAVNFLPTDSLELRTVSYMPNGCSYIWIMDLKGWLYLRVGVCSWERTNR